jgi:hypothetical protein
MRAYVNTPTRYTVTGCFTAAVALLLCRLLLSVLLLLAVSCHVTSRQARMLHGVLIALNGSMTHQDWYE